MLLLDRFLVSDSSGLDLATGLAVRIRRLAGPRRLANYARRGSWTLLDAGPYSKRGFAEAWGRGFPHPLPRGVSLDPIRDALLDARDGHPRAVDLCAAGATEWLRTTSDLAVVSREAGFVPVDAAVLGEILRGARWAWPAWLADRSLVVITCDGSVSSSAALALLRLACRDDRPHIIVRGATGDLLRSERLVLSAGSVHESDAGQPGGTALPASPSALADRAWQMVGGAPGDTRALSTARWAVLLAADDATRADAEAALATALVANGQPLEARAALARAEEVAGGGGTDRLPRLAVARSALAVATERAADAAFVTRDVLALLELCQDVADESTTLPRALALLGSRLGASAVVAVVSRPDGAVRIAVHGRPGEDPDGLDAVLGGGPAQTVAGGRGAHAVWPVRYAGTICGALWARWQVPPRSSRRTWPR